MSGIAHCSSCGAPIVWVLSRKGNLMPLDAEPTGDGQFVITDETGIHDGKPVRRARFVAAGVDEADDRHLSHFVTCPNRDEHRRR